MPAMAKSGANYMNSQLIKMEALLNALLKALRSTTVVTFRKARARIFL